jgi:uridine phosphorylase
MGAWQFYDPSPDAVINASEHHKRVEGFPPLVISAFSGKLASKVIARYNARQIALLDNSQGGIPIYVLPGDTDVAFFVSPIGAPAAVATFEQVIALGGRSFVYFGSCGTLDSRLEEAGFVVPTAAIRDEGASRHYQPPGDEIELDAESIQVVCDALTDIGYPYIKAKTWTTDAIYRETREKMREARLRGCAVVEMECAALTAAALFRGVRFAQFLYTADNLDSPKWEARDLRNFGVSGSERYIAVALKSVLSLGKLSAGNTDLTGLTIATSLN